MRLRLHLVVLTILTSSNCFAQIETTLSNNPATSTKYQIPSVPLQTRWAKEVNPNNALKEYPRPQLQRKQWTNLNGLWDYAITDSLMVNPTIFKDNILVPYPIESALSGVQRKIMPNERLWYRKIIPCPTFSKDEHIILNFGAVDWEATVFVNDKLVGRHSGGYQNFSFDITKFLTSGQNEIKVRVFDPSDQGINPHGKQVLNPSNIYYTPSSGIWQTVWLEKVPSTYITKIKTIPDIDKGILNLYISASGTDDDVSIEITASANKKIIAQQRIPLALQKKSLHSSTAKAAIKIPDIKLWTPDNPFLYDLSINIIRGKKVVDEVVSYFGMRKIDIQKDERGNDRIFLNNKYTYNLGILDQGFWPEGLYTAPTDEALSFDIKAIKSMGFNTIRKHIKIEPERWYYHADKIGILVWQDFVNPPNELPQGSKSTFEKEILETIEQLESHPCIVTWVLFNERWGVYDQERLTKLVKGYDPSRIVNGHSGELLYVNDLLRAPSTNPWVNSDMTDIHAYPNPRNVPGLPNKAKVIGEFGGIGVSVEGHEWDDLQGWGYVKLNAGNLKIQYASMIDSLNKLEKTGLSGSIYTQPFDVEGEENGLLTYDREIIKIPIDEIRLINKKMVNQTKGFALDPHFFIAANIDPIDNEKKYDNLLQEYINGKRDSIFLRRLVLTAIRKKDQEEATKIGNDYINILTQPFSKKNLDFILNITKTSNDNGFKMFLDQSSKVDSVLGSNTSLRKIKEIIDIEDIDPYYKNNPDWETIQRKISNKYGEIGEEYVLGKRMIYYGFETMDWKNFGIYYKRYFEKSLKHEPEYLINNITWVLYEHVDDTEILTFATDVMKYIIEKWDHSPEAYDTYANLLHRIKKSSEAIKWEEKAVEMMKGTPEEKTFAETLQKMKSGLPTWPQNN